MEVFPLWEILVASQWTAWFCSFPWFTHLFLSRVVRPVPFWNERVCGCLWSSRSTSCHFFPKRPSVVLHCLPAQSFVLRFDLHPTLQISASGCYSFSPAASKHSRDSQNISHVETYKIRMNGENGENPSIFSTLWTINIFFFFYNFRAFFYNIRTFLCLFACISVCICLTRKLNAWNPRTWIWKSLSYAREQMQR